MTYLDFETGFKGLPVIPLTEIAMRFPRLNRGNLLNWQRKGLVQKVRNGYYRIASRPWDDHERWAIANGIYQPSYVSLRSALGYHGFIPEGVFHVESVTTNLTKRFGFNGTQYSYRTVRPSFYFGYRFVEQRGVRVMMASPEKALLDLLYLHPEVATDTDFETWRLDAEGILESIDEARMDDFAEVAGSRALTTRYRKLKKWLHDHAG